jgi:hypothetical protein
MSLRYYKFPGSCAEWETLIKAYKLDNPVVRIHNIGDPRTGQLRSTNDRLSGSTMALDDVLFLRTVWHEDDPWTGRQAVHSQAKILLQQQGLLDHESYHEALLRLGIVTRGEVSLERDSLVPRYLSSDEEGGSDTGYRPETPRRQVLESMSTPGAPKRLQTMKTATGHDSVLPYLHRFIQDTASGGVRGSPTALGPFFMAFDTLQTIKGIDGVLEQACRSPNHF